MDFSDGYCYLHYVALLHNATGLAPTGATGTDPGTRCGRKTNQVDRIITAALKSVAGDAVLVRCGRLANREDDANVVRGLWTMANVDAITDPSRNRDSEQVGTSGQLVYTAVVTGRCVRRGSRNRGKKTSPATLNQRLIDASISLGPYPRAGALFSYLAGEFPSKPHVVLPLPTVARHNTLHVPTVGEYSLPLWVLCCLFRHSDTMVGGDDGQKKKNPNVDYSGVLQELGVDASKITQNLQIVGCNADALNMLSTEWVSHQVQSNIKLQGRKIQLKVDIKLSEEEKGYIRAAFGKINFEWTNKDTHPHGFAAVTRACELEYILNACSYDNVSKVANYDFKVIDVGGNWATHFRRGRRFVHSVSPCISANDSKRYTDRMSEMASRIRVTETQRQICNAYIDGLDYSNLESPLFCMKKGGQCKQTAPSCMFIHSAYDMTNLEIVDTLEAHTATVGFATMLFDPLIMKVTKSGTGKLNRMNAVWKIRDVNGKKMINFAFEGDSSWEYNHDLETYKQKFNVLAVYSTAGNKYFVTLQDNWNGSQLIKYSRQLVIPMAPSHESFSLWDDNLGMVEYVFYTLDPKYNYTGVRRFRRNVALVSASFVQRIVEYALRIDGPKFNVTELFAYGASIQSRVIVNGVTVSFNAAGVAPTDVLYLVNTIYITAYCQKYEAGLALQAMLTEAREKRSGMTLMGALISFVKDKFGSFIIDDLRAWAYSHLVTSKYETWVKNYDNRTHVSGTVNNSTTSYVKVHRTTDRVEPIIDDTWIYVNCNETSGELDLEGGCVEVMESISDCLEGDKKLVVVKTPGDGSCMLHAIGIALGKDVSYANDLIEKYKSNKQAPPCLKRKGTWGDTEAMRWIAQQENLSVCIHTRPGKLQDGTCLTMKSNSSSVIVHLLFANQHYSGMLEESVAISRGHQYASESEVIVGSKFTKAWIKADPPHCAPDPDCAVDDTVETPDLVDIGVNMANKVKSILKNLKETKDVVDKQDAVLKERYSTLSGTEPQPHLNASTMTAAIYMLNLKTIFEGMVKNYHTKHELVGTKIATVTFKPPKCVESKKDDDVRSVVSVGSVNTVSSGKSKSAKRRDRRSKTLSIASSGSVSYSSATHSSHSEVQRQADVVRRMGTPSGDFTPQTDVYKKLALKYGGINNGAVLCDNGVDVGANVRITSTDSLDRTNMYDWIVSVLSPSDVHVDAEEATYATYAEVADKIISHTADGGNAAMRVFGITTKDTRELIIHIASNFTTVSSYFIDVRTKDIMFVFFNRAQGLKKIRETKNAVRSQILMLYSRMVGDNDSDIIIEEEGVDDKVPDEPSDVESLDRDGLRGGADDDHKPQDESRIGRKLSRTGHRNPSLANPKKVEVLSRRQRRRQPVTASVYTREITLSELFTGICDSTQLEYASDVFSALGINDIIEFCERYDCSISIDERRWGTRPKHLDLRAYNKVITFNSVMKTLYDTVKDALWNVDTTRDTKHSTGVYGGISVLSRQTIKLLDVITSCPELVVANHYTVVGNQKDVSKMLSDLGYSLGGNRNGTVYVTPPLLGKDLEATLSKLPLSRDDMVVVCQRDYYCSDKVALPFTEVQLHKGLFNPADSEVFMICSGFKRDHSNVPTGDSNNHIHAVKQLCMTIKSERVIKVQAYSIHEVGTIIRGMLQYITSHKGGTVTSIVNSVAVLAKVLRNNNYRDVINAVNIDNLIFPGVSYIKNRIYIAHDFFVANNPALKNMVLYSTDSSLVSKFLIKRGDRRKVVERRHTEVLDRQSIERYWMMNKAYRTMWLLCDASYEIGRGNDIYARNAVRERMDIWRIHDAVLEGVYSKMMGLVNTMSFNVKALKKVMAANSENFGLIKDGKFLITPKEMVKQYDFGYNNGKFVKLDYIGAGLYHTEPISGYTIVGESTKLMQDTRLFNAMKDYDIDGIDCPPVKLITGVPGCGKTSYILKHRKSRDMVVTTTKENALDIRNRMKDRSAKDRVKTMHSIILHGVKDNLEVENLYVDEALMAHLGEIVMVAAIVKCKKIILLGDKQQIPFINRNRLVVTNFSSAEVIASEIEVLNVSYRVPQDVATYFSRIYPDGFCSKNPVKRSVSYKKVTNVKDLPKGVQIIVFKQAEKAALKTNGYGETLTVHEYQGKQSEEIVLYRDSTQDADVIYKSLPHVLVALTRHSVKFTYHTRLLNDPICKIIDAINGIPEEEFFRQLPVPQNTVQGEPTTTYDKLLDGKTTGARAVGALMLNKGRTMGQFTNTILRSGGYNLPTTRFISNQIPVRSVMSRRIKAPKVKAHIATLQSWIDIMMPGCNHHNTDYDDYQVHTNDFEIQFTNSVTFDSRLPWKKTKFDKLRPALKTAVPNERMKSTRELLLAFQKRNDNVPRLSALTDPNLVVEMMIDKLKNYFDPSKMHLLDAYREHPIDITEEGCQKWIDRQQGLKVPDQTEYIGNMSFTKYDYMIKTRPKPLLTDEAATTRGALQTIAHQSSVENAIWCPMFREMKQRLLDIMGPRFNIFTDLSIAEFEGWMNDTFPDGLVGNKIFELDISKYDKSQGDIALEFDCAVMRLFGFPEDKIELWRNAHMVTELMNRDAAFRATLAYQRKSGDAFTFLGNTLFLMATVAMTIDVTKVSCGVFAGDDSVLWTKDDIAMSTISLMEDVFNLEAKLFPRRYAYFCSKLLVFQGRWSFVPDLLKLVVKLGRKDLRNFTQMEEYRQSLYDLTRSYNSVDCDEVLNEAINERYPSFISDHSFVKQTILDLVATNENFSMLFYTLPGDVLCQDRLTGKLE